MSETTHISTAYQDRLQHDYGADVAATVASDWRSAELLRQPGETISYVRLNESDDEKLLFVPGFTGGIVANAPFSAAMASRGFDVILPDQNRKGLLRNERHVWDATYTQAANIGAIIAKEGLEDTPLPVVTHSYGSLIFEALFKQAKRQGWTCFDRVKAVMLAPSGVKRHEWLPDFAYRYYQLLHPKIQTEMVAESYGEFGDEMFKAGMSMFNANRLRVGLEAAAIMKRKVHLDYLLQNGIDSIALTPFAGDQLFGRSVLDKTLGKMKHERVTVFTPLLPSTLDSSGHSDQQFNPEIVANSVAHYLRD